MAAASEPSGTAGRKRTKTTVSGRSATGRKTSPIDPNVHDVDADTVERLAMYGCTNIDIAAEVGVSEAVLVRWFSEHIERGRALCRNKLRYMQWEAASKGNSTMLIWLGKQLLGQREDVRDDNLKPSELSAMVSAMVAASRRSPGPSADTGVDEQSGTVQHGPVRPS